MAKGRDKAKAGAEGVVIENRKARHDYEILSTLEVGMKLLGSEVKSIRDGKASLAEGYVRVEDGTRRIAAPKRADGRAPRGKPRMAEPGLWLHGVNIAEYPPAGRMGSAGQHPPTRVRQLLCHKRELVKMAREVEAKGVTVVPLKIYFKDGKAKLLIGVARGRTKGDKREAIAKRETRREIDRAMSRRM